MPQNGIRILSIDAKDIYIANHYKKEEGQIPEGYRIRYGQGKDKGEINTGRFTNTLDESLDLHKLRMVYEKTYRNRSFAFEKDNHSYTTRVINVTFRYSNKEYNKARKDTYVKFGHCLQDMVFRDHICLSGDELAGIEVNQDVEHPLPESVLSPHFTYKNGQYRAKANRKPLHTVQELRTLLYEQGFWCDGVKYVRYKRSGGSARAGKCLFIDEKLSQKMMKWAMCGLSVKAGQEVDLAGLEAYLALPLSSIIGTLSIKPENFLVIEDHESVFREKAVETRLQDGQLTCSEKTVTLCNSIWDGQSLMDTSLFSDYPDRGMLLLRNKFFKSACFHCNIQDFFADRGITDISQLNGHILAKNIADIRIITTPSSIKYLKFGSLKDWFTHMEPLFGIVKHEKPTHFFDGRMVQTHYQLLNTLQLNEADMEAFLKPSLDYLRLLKTDPAVLRYHIRYPQDCGPGTAPLLTKNDIVYRLLGINERFCETKLYDDFKNSLTKAWVKNLRLGHVLVNGNYSALLGNPVEMLMQAAGCFDGKSRIGKGRIHTRRFPYGQKLLGSRSPHVTIGNVWLTVNTENKEIDRYCNLSPEIVCVNSIGESLQDRLSGCDFDSDTVLLTDHPLLIRAAEKNYNIFRVPVNHVDAARQKRYDTAAEKAGLDIATSDNKIGDIINLSQELNTLLWHRMNHGASYEDIKDLYYDICKLDVLSGIEIDKAKREYTTDTYREMKQIKEKWKLISADGRSVKPNFFAQLARAKGYYDTDRKQYLRHDTSMDYLQKVINRFQADKRGKTKKKTFLSLSDILNGEGCRSQSIYYEQAERVFGLTEQYLTRIKKIYADESLDLEARYLLASTERRLCAESIGKMKFSQSTIHYLLRQLDCEPHQNYAKTVMGILFGFPNLSFYQLIRESKGHLPILMETESGEIDLYGFSFRKIPVS